MPDIYLKPHQSKALEELHNGSVLRGGVGSGKSITAVVYYLQKECGAEIRLNGRGDFGGMATPKDLVIITTVKKRDEGDWLVELANFRLGRDPDASLGHTRIIVDSWNNIEKYKDVKNTFFIFDEQRLVGAGAWVKAFINIAKYNRWIMLSATPGDTWMEYIPLFIANGFYKNRTEFIRRHVVYSNFTKFPKIDRYVETGLLEKLRRRITVDMPYERGTKRHVRHIIVDYNAEAYQRVVKDRWNIFENRPLKDVSEMFAVMRKLVNTDLSRYGALMRLMEKHDKLIVFYNFNYELDILRVLASTTGVLTQEWNGQKHEPVPTGDKWLYLVQYTAGAEGWNCIETDSIAFWSLNYSYKIWEQAQGRIDRMNTLFIDLWYYVFRSPASIDTAVWKALTTKQNFNERSYARENRIEIAESAA